MEEKGVQQAVLEAFYICYVELLVISVAPYCRPPVLDKEDLDDYYLVVIASC